MRYTSFSAPPFEPLEPRLLLAADWTVLYYVDGDNNLEDAAIKDINEMEKVGSSASLNIVAEVDRISGYDNSNGNWTDTRRGEIIYHPNTGSIGTTLASIGEKNMGAPATLTDFITWGVANYPANHYALVLWDHGGGTGGACWDDTSNDNLTIAELGQGIAGSGVHFDIVGFDACMMSMLETAYELRSYTDYVVGSEQTEPWDGWPHDLILGDLAASPTMSAQSLATSIVTRYGQSYNGAETMSAVSSAGVVDLAQKIDAFAGAAISSNTDWGAISAARSDSPYFTDSDFRDLGKFLNSASINASSASVRTAAQAAYNSYNSTVIANHSSASDGGTGLSIYLPGQGGAVSSSYTSANFKLLADTRWDDLVNSLSNTSGGTDVNGTIGAAYTISGIPATIQGNVGVDGNTSVGGRDVDFYSFVAASGQTIGFDIDANEQGGALDGILRLFDSTGKQLALNDDAHDPDTNIASYDPYIEYTFTKTGTYYIAVSGYNNAAYNPTAAGSGVSGSTGSYTLRVRSLGGVSDTNGTIPGAVDVGSSPIETTGTIGDEPSGAKDVDFYAVQVETNQVLTFTLTPGVGFAGYLRLFKSDGSELAHTGDTTPLEYDFSGLSGGTYYIGISGSGNISYDPFTSVSGTTGTTGSYTLDVTGSSVHLDFNGTIMHATGLGSIPAAVNAAIGDEPAGALDVDFYQFQETAGQTIRASVDAGVGGLQADMRLFDASGNELAADIDGDSDVSIQYTFVAGGNYYLAVSGSPNHVFSPLVEMSGVSGSVGPYTLNATSVVGSADTNGTIATATPVTVGSQIDGEIGDEPAGTFDVDLYSFHVNAGAQVAFDINTPLTSNLDSVLRLFDASGNQLAVNDDDPNAYSLDSYLRYTFAQAGTYFVGVSGYPNSAYDANTAMSGVRSSTGDYTLSVQPFGPDPSLASVTHTSQPNVLPGDRKNGKIKSVIASIANFGTVTARGSATINLYASTTPTPGSGTQVLLASTQKSMSIKPGKSINIKWNNIKMPDFPAGAFYLIATITPISAANDVNTANNTATDAQSIFCLQRSRGAVGGLSLASNTHRGILDDKRSFLIKNKSSLPATIKHHRTTETDGAAWLSAPMWKVD